jgi:hypothetical protein
MISFGSAINFYGGVGECNHKKFVKSTGINTQKRIKNFTSQVATRYYEAMTFEIANKCLENKRRDGYMDDQELLSRQHRTATMEGKYILTIDGLEENGLFTSFSVDNKGSLLPNLIRGIAIYAAREMNNSDRISIVGYTSCKLHIDKREEFFRCTSKYSGVGQWYDWCLVEWVDSRKMSQTYPGLILGFIQAGMKYCAVIQSSNDPMSMEKMTQEFTCKSNCPLTLQQVLLRLSQSAIHYVSSRITVDPNQNIFVHYLKENGLAILMIEYESHKHQFDHNE